MLFILIAFSLILVYSLCASITISTSRVALRCQVGVLCNKIDRSCSRHTLRASSEDPEVKAGSKEYYKGFLESSLNENTNPRGDGLKQALALAGNATIILVILTAAFLKSNGVF